jgi:hypothetical protein
MLATVRQISARPAIGLAYFRADWRPLPGGRAGALGALGVFVFRVARRSCNRAVAGRPAAIRPANPSFFNFRTARPNNGAAAGG